MKKSILILCSIFIVITAIAVLVVVKISKNDYHDIAIVQYQPGTLNEIKRINIESEKDVKQITKYLNKIESSKNKEDVKLLFINEIAIKYDGSKTVFIQSSEEQYCEFNDAESNTYRTVKMPSGLYKWVMEKIK